MPGRNLVFFIYAAALGYRRGLTTLVGGMCETDFSGYPDCRDATLRALEQAIRLGTEIPFAIETPLMWRTKAETWALTEELGGDALVELIIEETHTCYRGERGKRHDWGYGCGAAPPASSAPAASPNGSRPRSKRKRLHAEFRSEPAAFPNAPQQVVQTRFMSVAGGCLQQPP